MRTSESRIAGLRARLADQERAKRYHEYVKTLLQLADEVSEPAEKAELYLRAADLYVNKFANHAEAIHACEAVLEVDSENAAAIDYLRQMYEKRRDWERLVALSTREAKRLEPGRARLLAYKEIAKLATERIKKPVLCIELWDIVLAHDEEDLDALAALAQLYERARNYEALANVLEKQAGITLDTRAKVQILTKLGQVTGDRLRDDARAADAYRLLLTLQPDDRRARKQLKKHRTASGR